MFHLGTTFFFFESCCARDCRRFEFYDKENVLSEVIANIFNHLPFIFKLFSQILGSVI